MDTQSPDSAPAALADLVAAGLVSHEMIGDPGRLGGEAEALRALCRLVAGPVWRIEPFHYAFRTGPGDPGGTPAKDSAEDSAEDSGGDSAGDLDPAAPEELAAALEAALQAELGADAVWVSATEILPAEETACATALAQPLALLRAQGIAVEAGLEAAGAGVQAIVNARFAAAAAQLVAGAEPGSVLDARLSAIEANQAALLAALGPGLEEILARLAESLAAVRQTLDAQADTLQAHVARAAETTARIDALAELSRAPDTFQETLGVTLAELIARLERRAEEAAPLRVPQFS